MYWNINKNFCDLTLDDIISMKLLMELGNNKIIRIATFLIYNYLYIKNSLIKYKIRYKKLALPFKNNN